MRFRSDAAPQRRGILAPRQGGDNGLQYARILNELTIYQPSEVCVICRFVVSIALQSPKLDLSPIDFEQFNELSKELGKAFRENHCSLYGVFTSVRTKLSNIVTEH